MSHEWNSIAYAANSEIQYLNAQEIVESWSFTGSEYILDIGCGNGAITKLLAKKVASGSVLGIDASSNMIEYAKKIYSCENLKFETVSATKLSFKTNFNLAFSFNCLHWIEDKQAVFDGVYNALIRKGAFIFLFSITKPGGYTILEIANRLKNQEFWKPYFQNHSWPWFHETENTIIDIVNKSGFSIKNWHVGLKSARFSNKYEMVNHLLALSWLNNLPKKLQRTFVKQLIDIYISEKSPYDESPMYSYPVYQLFGILEKS